MLVAKLKLRLEYTGIRRCRDFDMSLFSEAQKPASLHIARMQDNGILAELPTYLVKGLPDSVRMECSYIHT